MDIYTLLDRLQAIARDGLHYATNPFDRERYERLMDLACETYSEALETSTAEIKARFLGEIGTITPKVGTDAAIFNSRGEILLMDRADGSGWCLPCGFVEPNETPVEGIIREVREETGLEVQINRLVGVFTRKPSAQYGPHTTLSIVHLCDVIGGQLALSHEGLGLQYWDIGAVPRWHTTHEKLARAAYKIWTADEFIQAICE